MVRTHFALTPMTKGLTCFTFSSPSFSVMALRREYSASDCWDAIGLRIWILQSSQPRNNAEVCSSTFHKSVIISDGDNERTRRAQMSQISKSHTCSMIVTSSPERFRHFRCQTQRWFRCYPLEGPAASTNSRLHELWRRTTKAVSAECWAPRQRIVDSKSLARDAK